MENNMYFWSYLSVFLEGAMLQTKFVQKIKHKFYIPYVYKNTFFLIRALY